MLGRRVADMTQAELARAVNVPVGTVRRLERADRVADAKAVEKIIKGARGG